MYDTQKKQSIGHTLQEIENLKKQIIDAKRERAILLGNLIQEKEKQKKGSVDSTKTCKKLNTKKYASRKAPPYSAASCARQTLVGNDGKKYISDKRGKGKSFRWYLVKEKEKSNKLSPGHRVFDVRKRLGFGFRPTDDVLNNSGSRVFAAVQVRLDLKNKKNKFINNTEMAWVF